MDAGEARNGRPARAPLRGFPTRPGADNQKTGRKKAGPRRLSEPRMKSGQKGERPLRGSPGRPPRRGASESQLNRFGGCAQFVVDFGQKWTIDSLSVAETLPTQGLGVTENSTLHPDPHGIGGICVQLGQFIRLGSVQIFDRHETMSPKNHGRFTFPHHCSPSPSRGKTNNIAPDGVFATNQECLNHFLFLSEDHLRRTVLAYIAYYNEAMPHQGIEGIPEFGPGLPRATLQETGERPIMAVAHPVLGGPPPRLPPRRVTQVCFLTLRLAQSGSVIPGHAPHLALLSSGP